MLNHLQTLHGAELSVWSLDFFPWNWKGYVRWGRIPLRGFILWFVCRSCGIPWVSPAKLSTGDLPNSQHYRLSHLAVRNVLWHVFWAQWNCLVQTDMYWQRSMFPFLRIWLCISSTSTSFTEYDAERGIANGDARKEFSEGKVCQ
jgi:hypothetical protein